MINVHNTKVIVIILIFKKHVFLYYDTNYVW